MPTQIMGIVAIEKQVLKMLGREDCWIQHDMTEHQNLDLHRLINSEEFNEDSNEWKTLHQLTRFSFDKFLNNMRKYHYYTKVPVFDADKLTGNKLRCKDGDPTTAIFIHVGGRCPLPYCVAMDYQCCHNVENDDGKWGIWYWCNTLTVKHLVIMGTTSQQMHVEKFMGLKIAEMAMMFVMIQPLLFFLQQSTSSDDSKDEFEEGMAEDLGRMTDTSVLTMEKKNETPSILYYKLTTYYMFSTVNRRYFKASLVGELAKWICHESTKITICFKTM